VYQDILVLLVSVDTADSQAKLEHQDSLALAVTQVSMVNQVSLVFLGSLAHLVSADSQAILVLVFLDIQEILVLAASLVTLAFQASVALAALAVSQAIQETLVSVAQLVATAHSLILQISQLQQLTQRKQLPSIQFMVQTA